MRLHAAVMVMMFAGALNAAAPERRFALIGPDGKPEGSPALDLSAPAIVLYCPGALAACGAAMDGIEKDPAASAALNTRAIFLLPPGGEGAAGWNKRSRHEYAAVYATADWPELAGASGPRLVFYAGGEPVCSVDGQENAANPEAFRSCMDKAGLLTFKARLETCELLIWNGSDKDGAREAALGALSGEAHAMAAAGAFGGTALKSYDRPTLKLVFGLINNVNFYTPDEVLLKAETAALAAMREAGLPVAGAADEAYTRLVDYKLFGEAASLRAMYPEAKLRPVPPVNGSTETAAGQALLYFTEDGKTSLQAEVVPSSATRIIFAGSPGCHFAQNGLKEIQADPELGPLFAKHALLLTSRVDLRSLGRWNKANGMKYRITARDSDWPGVDFSNSPSIYFMKEGRIVHTVGGYSGKDFLPDMAAGAALLYPEMKPRGAPKLRRKQDGARMEMPKLGDFLKGLNAGQVNRFCAGIRFKNGKLAGAYMDEVRAVLGEAAAARLEAYMGGLPSAAGADGAATLGEHLKQLDQRQLNRTCGTITFYGGRFGGLNFRDLEDVYGASGYDYAAAYFNQPGKESGK